VRTAVSTTGVAVVLTAATVMAGLAFWSLSPVRFQAEMAFLLALLMLSNAVSAVVLVPALFRLAWTRRASDARR
jgi:predicted RND superfamily exporter protein